MNQNTSFTKHSQNIMSASYELNQQSFKKDYGEIVLYQRPKTPKWQTRIKINGSSGYVRKSTKTTDLVQARIFSEQLYESLVSKYKATGSTDSKSFKKVANEWLTSLKLRGERESKIKEYRERLERYAIKYFGNTLIDSIKSNHIISFMEWRETQGRKSPSEKTKIRELVPVKLLFDYAFNRNYILKQPEFPKIKTSVERRPAFSESEWERIVNSLNLWLDDAKKNHPEQYRDRVYLKYFITILGESGIRPGTESQSLTWDSFKKVKFKNHDKPKLIIHVTKGKTGSRVVVPLTRVNRNKQALLKFRKAELEAMGKPFNNKETIFCHKDGRPILSFKKGFRAFLEAYGLSYDEHGVERVPYSLRHTYATRMIRQKIAHMDLAKNMGTSVKMLEKHYVQNNPTEYGEDFLSVETPLIRR